MNKLKILILASCVFVVSCAYKPKQYEGDSLALKIMKEVKKNDGLKDYEIPKEGVNGHIANSLPMGVADATLSHMSPTRGFTNMQSMGLSMASWLISNKRDAHYSQHMAWMPVSQSADSPKKELENLIGGAVKKFAKANGYEVEINTPAIPKVFGGGHYPHTFVHASLRGGKCINYSKCTLSFTFDEPKKISAPEWLTQYQGQKMWFFDPLDSVNKQSFTVYSKNAGWEGVDQLEMLVEISGYMPDWYYLYVSPEAIHRADGKKWEIPLLLNQGQPLYFIKQSAN